MNVPLLRRAQRSILDYNQRFDMHRWTCCMAGHIVKAADPSINLERLQDPNEFAAALVGISEYEAHGLFLTWGSEDYTREQAVARINKLIIDHAEEGQSVGGFDDVGVTERHFQSVGNLLS
jgi:hypothetical protein